VEDGQTDTSSHKLEIIKMPVKKKDKTVSWRIQNFWQEFKVSLGIDCAVRVNLERIVVVRRILEQSIKRLEQLVRQQEEKLSADTAIIQAFLVVEAYHEPLLEVVGRLPHDLGIAVLKYVVTSDLDVALSRNRPKSWLGTEVDQLSTEIALVLRYVLVERRR
jgi:hypothetical protein